MTEPAKRYIIVASPLLSKGDKGDAGQDGEDASFSLPLSSNDIIYPLTGETVTEALDRLGYVALTIDSFTGISIYEKGQILTSIFLSWTYNKDVQSQAITGIDVVTPTLILSDRSKLVTLTNIAINTTITLTADDDLTDEVSEIVAIFELQFLNKIHYGKATHPGTVNSAFLNGLTRELAATKAKSFSENTSVGEYIWFACPTTYGFASFISNGFAGGFTLEGTISHTNESGHTENYFVYRSEYTNLGATSIQVY